MTLSVIPVGGLPEVRPGDDLAGLILDQATLLEGDVVVVTQKVVSKAEGRLEALSRDDPRARAALVERESRRVLRRRGDLVVSETHQGFVCANAGVDLSNVEEGHASLLPRDADRSARRIRESLRARTGLGRDLGLGVIVSDTFGRPWRRGSTDVAIGCAGVAAVVDLRGQLDALGRTLEVTEVCVADELASAAELVMGKAAGIAAGIVRGVDPAWLRESSVSEEIVRPPNEDLFR
ncbi:MAG: coenzyme F420-0:L-glutamate ligase [Actinomycetota bacterium]|nr:coenzyme F420-0:L-glutamate ligase [Actinomycetota bacterium]